MNNWNKNTALLLTSLFLLNCQSSNNKPVTNNNDAVLNNSNGIIEIEDTVSTYMEEEDSFEPHEELTKEPKEIGFNIFEKQVIQLNDTFNPSEALHKIYKGDTVKDEWEGNYPFLEVWKSNKYESKKFEGSILEDTVLFPATLGNDTRILAVYDFEDLQKNSFKILATSSSEFTPYHELSGRYICGILGLSIFQKNNNKWDLRAFNPALGCYGMFQTVSKPDIISSKNSFILSLNNIQGGPAEVPYLGNLTLFALHNKEFKIVLKELNTYRQGSFEENSSWNTQVIIEKSTDNNPPENLQLITSGNFNYDGFITNDTISNLPKILLPSAKPGENFSFEIKRNYIFKDGIYALTEEKLVIKKK